MSRRAKEEQARNEFEATKKPPAAPTAEAVTAAEEALERARARVRDADRAATAAQNEQAAALSGVLAAERALEAEVAKAKAAADQELAEVAAKDPRPIASYKVVGGPGFRDETFYDGNTGRKSGRKVCTVSMNGSLANIVLGQIVKLQAYGRDGLDRMRRAGVVLEPIA